jgi:hypothetical protein
VRRVAALIAVALAGGLLAGCGGGDSGAESGAGTVEALESDFLPQQVLGLSVGHEDLPSGIESVRASYLEAVSLFSLRSEDQLQATLQVGRFRDGVDFDDPGFRTGLLTQIGSTRPQGMRLGERTVYMTTGLEQRLAIWFSGDHMLILGTREEFDRPRTLLREMLELEP